MWVITTKKDVLVNVSKASQLSVTQYFNEDESLRGTAVVAVFEDGPRELAYVAAGERAEDRIPVYMSALMAAIRTNQPFCDLMTEDAAVKGVTFSARRF